MRSLLVLSHRKIVWEGSIALSMLVIWFSQLAAAANPVTSPRVEFWSLNNKVDHLRDKAFQRDALGYVRDLRNLPDLTDYEFTSIDLVEALLICQISDWRPSIEEEQQKAIDRLNMISSEASETGSDLYAAAEEALVRSSSLETSQQIEHARNALNFWSNSTDLEFARKRYISLAFDLPEPSWWEIANSPEIGSTLREMLRAALNVAKTPDDFTRIHWKLAKQCRNSMSNRQILEDRAEYQFDAAVKAAPTDTTYLSELLYDAIQFENNRPHTRFNRQLKLADRFLEQFGKEDSSQVRVVQTIRNQIVAPDFALPEIPTIVPGTEILVELESRNVKKFTAELHSIGARDFLGAKVFPGRKKSSGTKVWKQSFKCNATEGYEWSAQEVRLSSGLEPGFYRLRVSDGEKSKERFFVISSSAAVLKAEGGNAAVYLCDSIAGSPVKDAEVVLLTVDRQNQLIIRETSFSAKTNCEGVAWFDLHSLIPAKDRLFVAIIEEQQPAIASTREAFWKLHDPNSQQVSGKIFCFTDRTAYRPGNTMHWKGIVRNYAEGVISVPETTDVNITIIDHEGAVATLETSTNEYGTFSGSFNLPADARLGTWSLRIEANDSVYGYASFAVEEYRLPEFTSMIEFDDGPHSMGSVINGRIKTHYYSGEPMPGARIELNIVESTFQDGWSYNWSKQFLSQEDEEPEPKTIKHLELTTDANGSASFSFETDFSDKHSLKYLIEAKTTDLAQRMIVQTEEISIHNHDFKALVVPEHSVMREGDTARIRITTTSNSGSPASLKGSLLLARRIDNSECRDTPQWESMCEIPVSTNKNGYALINLPRFESGEFQVVWTSNQVRSQQAKECRFFVGEPEVVSNGDYFRAVVDHQIRDDLIDQPGRPSHPSGTKIPILIFAHGSTGHALVTLYANGLREAFTVSLEQAANLIEVELKKEYGAGVMVMIDTYHEGNHYNCSEVIEIDHQLQPMKVTVSPGQIVASPGVQQELSLQVATPDGSVAAGVEVAISVYDEALLIYGDRRDTIELSPQYFVPSFDYPWIFDGDSGKTLGNPTTIPESLETIYDEDVLLLSPFEVTTSSDEGYRSSYSTSGTSLSMMLRDIPVPLEVVNSELLRDISSGNFAKVLELSAGVFTQKFQSLNSLKNVRIRSNFAKSAFWTNSVITDAGGNASVTFKLPDSLTAWRVEAVAIRGGEEIGNGRTEFRTSVPVSGRLHTPRFLVVGDEADISIVTNNNSGQGTQIITDLKAGHLLKGETETHVKTIPARKSARSDWRLQAVKAGTVDLSGIAASEVYSDGMHKSLNIIEHGLEKQISQTGRLGEGSHSVTFNLPNDYQKESASIQIHLEQGIASTMLTALPYLVKYPYSCVEQTTSKLVPITLLVERLTRDGANQEKLLKSIGFDSLSQYQAFRHRANERLKESYSFNGWWGWYSSRHGADDYMTAFAYWGQMLLQEEDQIDFDETDLNEIAEYLEFKIVEYDERPEMQSWMIFSLMNRFRTKTVHVTDEGIKRIFQRLFERRRTLNPSALAWMAMSYHWAGNKRASIELLEILSSQAVLSRAPGTDTTSAHWGRGERQYFRWNDHPLETTAWTLMALALIDPDSPLVESALHWLIQERKSNRWESTRSTMITLMAMEEVRRNAYNKESQNSATVRVIVNDLEVGEIKIPLGFDGESLPTLNVPFDCLRPESNQVEFEYNGKQPIYFSVNLNYFDESEPIEPTESGLRVTRNYYHILKTPTLLNGPRNSFTSLKEGDHIKAGEEIEVRLVIETATDLDYLMIEDFRPAGCEALDIGSGFSPPARELTVWEIDENSINYSGREAWIYTEIRDQLRASFIDSLPQGVWEVRYRLRAETPGKFHALPTKVEAMYCPATRGTSAESRVEIRTHQGEATGK